MINPSMITEQRFDPSPNAASEHKYAMHGKRLLVAGESKRGQRIDAGQVKGLTGDDKIECRPNFGKTFVFDPTHTLCLHTNHMPIGMGSTDAFERLRNAMDAEISQVLMGQTLTAQVGETGSYAASKTHEDVLEDYREADQRLVKDVMDEIGKIYRDINAPDTPAPVFTWFESEDPQADFAERDKALTESGLKIKKAYYVRRYGFNEDEIEVGEPEGGQDKQPQTTGGKQDFAEGEGQTSIEDALLAWAKEHSARPAASMIDAAEQLLGQVESLEEFRDRLIELFAASEPTAAGVLPAAVCGLGEGGLMARTRLQKEKAKHRTGLIKRLTRENTRRKIPRGHHGIFLDELSSMFKGA